MMLGTEGTGSGSDRLGESIVVEFQELQPLFQRIAYGGKKKKTTLSQSTQPNSQGWISTIDFKSYLRK